TGRLACAVQRGEDLLGEQVGGSLRDQIPAAADAYVGQRRQNAASAVLQPTQKAVESAPGDGSAEVPRGHVLEVVRLIQNEPLVLRQDRWRIVIPLRLSHRDVREEQMVIHHQQIRGGRLAPRLLVETLLEV